MAVAFNVQAAGRAHTQAATIDKTQQHMPPIGGFDTVAHVDGRAAL